MKKKTIRQLREERGWSQQDLAQQADVSVSTVFNWERGRHEPRLAQFAQLAKLFKVPMEQIGLTEPPKVGAHDR